MCAADADRAAERFTACAQSSLYICSCIRHTLAGVPGGSKTSRPVGLGVQVSPHILCAGEPLTPRPSEPLTPLSAADPPHPCTPWCELNKPLVHTAFVCTTEACPLPQTPLFSRARCAGSRCRSVTAAVKNRAPVPRPWRSAASGPGKWARPRRVWRRAQRGAPPPLQPMLRPPAPPPLSPPGPGPRRAPPFCRGAPCLSRPCLEERGARGGALSQPALSR